MKTGILLSGGMDSIALTYWKKPEVALTIDYGQICAEAEIRASAVVCRALGIQHEIITVNCRQLGSGDLANIPASIVAPVPEWWPFRNQFIITVAAMRGIAISIKQLLFGAVKSDSAHVDGSKIFFHEIDRLISIQEGNISILAPAIEMTTTELVKVSGIEMSILGWAHSCHVSNYACGNCHGCFKHQFVMSELGYEAY